MKVVITGGAGFLGLRLAKNLSQIGELTGPKNTRRSIDTITLFDLDKPSEPVRKEGMMIEAVTGDISDHRTVNDLIDRDDISVFHLASVVSAGGEQDFDLAMRVNLDGTRNVLECMRSRNSCPRLVLASSIAVFGGASMAKVVGDTAKQTPQTTYGITKAISELLVNDYTRKGYINGRSARLPHVIIRPGKPNAAASGFASAIFREPLGRIDYTVPVSLETPMPILGYRAITAGLVHLHELNDEDLGDDRAISLPSHTVTVQDMIEVLQNVKSDRKLGQITIKPDPRITKIINTWPLDSDWGRAKKLGFPIDEGLKDIVSHFIEDYLVE